MSLGLRCRLVDLGMVTAVLLLAATPLVFLRYQPQLAQRTYQVGFLVAVVGTLVLWALLRWRLARAVPLAASACEAGTGTAVRLAWWQTTLVALLLALCVIVCFYLPLRLSFWAGADDFNNFLDLSLWDWMRSWDRCQNRPFSALPISVGAALTPRSVEGFLWLAAGLCWANALLLFAILRQLLPQARVLPVAAAVLLAVDRADVSRFQVLRAANFYWMALAMLLLGTWLFLYSFRRGSRPLLLLSCLPLGVALLANEGTYPLAAFIPVLAWCIREHRGRLAVWSYAWYGTIALLATRLLHFLARLGADSYQLSTSAGWRDPEVIQTSLFLHLKAILLYFQITGSLADHWRTTTVILGVVCALAAVVARRAAGVRAPRYRHYLAVLGIAVLGFLLGVVPFLAMPSLFRTHFFAAPGQAVLVAAGLCLLGCLLGRRCGAALVIGVVALVAANATTEAVTEQRTKQTQALTFENAVHLFRQVHTVCPNPPPGSLVLLFYDDPTRCPFLANSCCALLAQRLLGVVAVPAIFSEANATRMAPVYHTDGVTLTHPEILPGADFSKKVGYDKVIAFRVAEDDTVTLLRHLPTHLLPPGHTADLYNPLALLSTGPVAELNYLRFSSWMRRPCDLFDMKDGVLLGRCWGRLENHEDELTRRVKNGAELFINSMGQNRREIHLEVAAEQSGLLEALDPASKVVAAADLGGRRQICLTVPTDPNRLSLIRLRVPGGQGAVVVQAFCPGSKGFGSRLVALRADRPADIATGELSLGDNWHPLETCGGLTFRWVPNDAEIILEADQDSPEDLVLDVQAGPSLGGGLSFRLSLLDPGGKALATADVENREVIRLPIPVGTPAGTVLRLHVEGGGRPARIGETRILNIRVMRCAWRTN